MESLNLNNISYGKYFNQTLDIYLPYENFKKDKNPVIFLIHGGGLLLFNNKRVKPLAKKFNKYGFIVVTPNYRKLNNVYINDCVNDVFGAFLWTKENIHKYNGDVKNFVMMGLSAGGLLASLVTNVRYNEYGKFPCKFIPSYIPVGKVDLSISANVMCYTSVDMWKSRYILLLPKFWKKLNLKPPKSLLKESNKFSFHCLSPLWTLPNTDIPPHLLIVGSLDQYVTIDEQLKYAQKIIVHGTKVKIIIVKNKKHDFLKHDNNNLIINKIVSFVKIKSN